MSENLLEVFDFTVEDMNASEKKESNRDFFNPRPEKGIAGVYDAVIRFIPFHKDPSQSIFKKSSFWLEMPMSNDKFGVDCPSNVGEKSELQEMFWYFWNNENASEKAKSKKFQRKENYYSIIQVVEDKNNPTNVGKLMIFKYGFKVHEKIQNEMKPKHGKPRKPFNLSNARNFGISVKKVNTWTNYDDCSFIEDSDGPLVIKGIQVDNSPESLSTLKSYLESGPDLLSQKHKHWTEEESKKVKEYINFYHSNELIVANTKPTDEFTKAAVTQSLTSEKPKVSTKKVEVKTEINENTETSDEVDDDPLAALYANI